MPRKRTKSELERSVDGIVWSGHIQAAKRPEEWLRWGAFALIGAFARYESFALVFALGILVCVVQVGLMRRRLGVKDASQILARMVPKMAAKNARRKLRKGTYDAEVGPEARAILERCAALANATVEASVETHMMNGGGRASLEAFRPLTRAGEESMKAALVRVQTATIMKRLPDEETLADLRAIEASLTVLREEARLLARDYRPAVALPADAGLAAERAEARRELDQGR